MALSVKCVLGETIRRFKLQDVSFDVLQKIIVTIFGQSNYIIRYVDSDNDICVIATTMELEEAVRLANNSGKNLKLFLEKVSSMRGDESILSQTKQSLPQNWWLQLSAGQEVVVVKGTYCGSGGRIQHGLKPCEPRRNDKGDFGVDIQMTNGLEKGLWMPYQLFRPKTRKTQCQTVTLRPGSRPALLALTPGDHTRNFYKANTIWSSDQPEFTSTIPRLLTNSKVPPSNLVSSDFRGSDSITFSINGVSHTVTSTDVSPYTMLAEFLRNYVGLTGTKIGCGEAGCGACTVMISKTGSNGSTSVIANACVRPVLSLDGASIITTEGIGSSSKGFHPIQTALAKSDGSQCGYCTPGMVMSMYGLLANTSKPSSTQIEAQLAGNICRCTGYRSILEAMNSVPQSKTQKTQTITATATTTTTITATPGPSCIKTQDGIWYNPVSLTDVFSLLEAHKSDPLRLTVGNTSVGVVKYYVPHPSDSPSVFINIASISELIQIKVEKNVAITFGASVTLSQVIIELEKQNTKSVRLARHLRLVAHTAVRNVASWAGNVMMAKNHPNFPSDVVTIFSGAGATITIQSKTASQKMDLFQFMSYKMPSDSIISSIIIPFDKSTDHFNSYKPMGRHINSHALVNGAFSVSLATGLNQAMTITSARIVFGNIVQGPLLCAKTAAGLVGKTLNLDLMSIAKPLLDKEIICSPPPYDPPFVVLDAAYRQKLAHALFYKFLLATMVDVFGKDSIDANLLSAAEHYQRVPSEGKQAWEPAPSTEAPVGQAIPKVEGWIQASGEAKYVSDMGLANKAFYGSPVLATKCGVTVASIDASAALAMTGVHAFISAKDVKDIGAVNSIEGWAVFATSSDKIPCVGQYVGLVVATTPSVAQRATKLVKVTYSGYKSSKTAFTIQKAVLQEGNVYDFHSVETSVATTPVGETATLSATLTTTGQKHFYMETQCSLGVPGEGDKFVLHAACQSLSEVRSKIAKMLNKSVNNITVCNTRVGGAYGGKYELCYPAAAAATIASIKLNAPVLVKLDRNTDMTSLGGRQPAMCEYTTTFSTSSHKITSLDLTGTVDSGFSTTKGGMHCTSLNGYDISGAKLKNKVAATDTPYNTIMRAPGDFQGSFFMEAVIESVAASAGVDPLKVQEANMDSACTSIWNEMLTQAQVTTKQQEVTAYNKANRWRKRGLYCMTVKYNIGNSYFSEQCVVTVLHDGSISVNHSGIEVGQGINTKVLQAVTMELSKTATVDMKLLSTVTPKSTDQFPSSTPTYGSGTSESCVDAVINACITLNEKLAPYKKSGATWKQIVSSAVAGGVDLTATGAHNIKGNYPLTCAVATVVELDVLTGECQVLTADLFYDCGISLNPGVDIGQVEGSFVQALGFCMSEEVVRSKVDGRLISNGTWDYKPPSVSDIPLKMNVTLVKSNNTAKGNVLGSKASGEPAYLLGACPFFALKRAIYAARADSGLTGYFRLDAPATPDRTQVLCNIPFI